MSKHKIPYDRTVHRLREIERIIKHRYGVLPDTDDAGIVLTQVACCQLQMRRKKLGQLPEFDELVDRVSLWCERWAPEASIFQCRDAAHEALRRRRIDSADDCAAQLRLSYEERTRLDITTIGSFDAGTGRALAAPRPRSFAVPLPLRKKEVAERSQLKRCRQTTQVNRPALSQYWWATHLRQLRSIFAPTRKVANDNGEFEKKLAP
jgi:hypothetical protein